MEVIQYDEGLREECRRYYEVSKNVELLGLAGYGRGVYAFLREGR